MPVKVECRHQDMISEPSDYEEKVLTTLPVRATSSFIIWVGIYVTIVTCFPPKEGDSLERRGSGSGPAGRGREGAV